MGARSPAADWAEEQDPKPPKIQAVNVHLVEIQMSKRLDQAWLFQAPVLEPPGFKLEACKAPNFLPVPPPPWILDSEIRTSQSMQGGFRDLGV